MHESFFDLITNLPHWEFEVVSSLLQDAVILFLARPFIKKYVKREHTKIDREHGVEHNDS